MKPARSIRFLAVYLFLLLAFAGAFARLAWVQLVRHDFYAAVARQQQSDRSYLPAARGVIYDRDMNPLAMSKPLYDIYALPRLIEDAGATARMLAPVLGRDEGVLAGRCASKAAQVWLARGVTPAAATKALALGLRGIFATPSERRVYPEGELGAHVLGYVGPRDGARAGVERTMDVYLTGLPGILDGGKDAVGRALPDLTKDFVPPMRGFGCVLTLDKWTQYVTERELRAACEKYDAESGAAVVMNPATGEILALASYPSYDPNRYGDFRPASWRNNAITAALEPGSIAKPFLVAAALEEGVVSAADTFDCSQPVVVAGRRITDVKPVAHPLALAEVIERSSNIGVVQVGQRLGGRRFYEYLRRFGFGERTDLPLPAENPGILRYREFLRPLGRAYASFGQGFSATPVQITAAACALANGGVLVKPILVSAIVDETGRTVRRFTPERQRRVISPATAAAVRGMMELVVEHGGGKLARLPGYRVAGKTGTSEVAAVGGGGYAAGVYNASFLGIVPADKPRVVIFITVHRPRGEYFGGLVAAPAFARIARDILPALQVPPTGVDHLKLAGSPRRIGCRVALGDVSAAAAVRQLSGLGLRTRVEGRGRQVLWTSADGGPAPPVGTVVYVRLGGGAPRMPAVVGLSIREAMRRLGPRAARVEVEGRGGWVVAQRPRAGARLGEGCRLSLGEAPARRRPPSPGPSAPPPGVLRTDIAG